ncbi:hypothetical protein PIB30_114800, partial [Stylosanthes scabra]|nr:hypothetical protein [Stylosanthes scabra]
MQGNRRDKQIVEIDPEIERTLRKTRQRVKEIKRALQGNPSSGDSSEDFSDHREEIFAEEIKDKMADEDHNQRRTLRDFITPTTVSCGSSVVRPT